MAIGASGQSGLPLATRSRFPPTYLPIAHLPTAYLPVAMRAGVPLVSGDRLVALQANGVLLRHRQLLPRHDVAFAGDDMEAARTVTGFAALQVGGQLSVQHPLAVGQRSPNAGNFMVTLHANLTADIAGVPSPQRRRNFLLRHHHRRQRQRQQSCRQGQPIRLRLSHPSPSSFRQWVSFCRFLSCGCFRLISLPFSSWLIATPTICRSLIASRYSLPFLSRSCASSGCSSSQWRNEILPVSHAGFIGKTPGLKCTW
ncbi:MAG: hypothetical protein PVTTEEND_000629 [Candidatus Fervidibacter sp.]